jgi:predicted lipid-binding transport protein (Tim44 family)
VLSPERRSDAATATLGIGAAVIAIACCAGVPAIGALLGGLTAGSVLGFGFGALILGALAWIGVAIITRRRHTVDRRRGMADRTPVTANETHGHIRSESQDEHGRSERESGDRDRRGVGVGKATAEVLAADGAAVVTISDRKRC